MKNIRKIHIHKKIGKTISLSMKAMEANHVKGIRLRSRIAVICALLFIVIDIIFVAYNYDYLPNVIPSFKDSNGVFIEAIEKSAYIDYNIQRLIMLFSAFFVTRVIRPCFKARIIYKRVCCFILDVVNLTVTSAIAMTMVEVAMARGESQEISYFSQWIAFLFWIVVMTGELAYDLRKIRKRKTKIKV